MQRGHSCFLTDLLQGAENGGEVFYVIAIAQYSRTGCRCKGDAHLQFRIIFSPSSMPRVRPCIIEDIFSLRMSFGVHWHDANYFTLFFNGHVKRLPTCFLASTAAFLKSVEKALLNEGIVWSRRCCKSAPHRRIYCVGRAQNFRCNFAQLSNRQKRKN